MKKVKRVDLNKAGDYIETMDVFVDRSRIVYDSYSHAAGYLQSALLKMLLEPTPAMRDEVVKMIKDRSVLLAEEPNYKKATGGYSMSVATDGMR